MMGGEVTDALQLSIRFERTGAEGVIVRVENALDGMWQ